MWMCYLQIVIYYFIYLGPFTDRNDRFPYPFIYFISKTPILSYT